MKECTICRHCYDDDIAFCTIDGATLQYSLPGSTLIADKYRLESLIARGSMGSVYKAQQAELLRPVAIKILNPQLLSSNIARERFRREALAVASLKHQNIVTVFDSGNTPQGVFYLVMELLEGRTLAERLNTEGRLDTTEALRIACEICDALTQAHARGIIHRDLKPSNIFLNFNGPSEMPKVIDFGLVKLKEKSDSLKSITAGALIGSLHYTAPEQCRSTEIDHRADIYSLGAILYHMLTGKLPFDTPNKAQLIYQQLNARPMPLHRIIFDIPPLVENAVLRALEKDPAARFQTITEFAAALKQAPKRALRRTVGMFLSGPIENMRSKKSDEEFQQATQRTLCFEHFIGRKRELAKLQLAYEQACDGRPTTFLITGDPGIGRSKLLAQVTKDAQESGAYCFTGQFTESVTSPWSLTNLPAKLEELNKDKPHFEKIFGSLSDAVAEAIEQPTISKLPTAALFQHQERRADRSMELLAQIFIRLSEDKPVIIALDDLHVADDVGLNFLLYLISAVTHSRILFLLTARAQEIARPENSVALWLDRLASQRQLQKLELSPLTEVDVRNLAEKIFEPIVISENTITRLYKLTEGNPFYLTSILRLLSEEGKISWDGEQWRAQELDEVKVPPSVTSMIEARLNFLSPQSRETLALAAILGETFSFEMLRKLSGLEEDPLMRIIDDGLRYALLREANSPQGGAQDDYYTFAQNALFQVLYAQWPEVDRRARHHQAAQILSEITPERGLSKSVTFNLAAKQFSLAGDVQGAFCQQVSAAGVAWRAGEVDLARKYLEEARKLSEKIETGLLFTGSLDKTATLAENFCDYLMLSVDLKLSDAVGQAEEWLERALLLAQKVGEPVLIARALVAAGHYQQNQGEYQRALSYFERAMSIYQEIGNKQRYNVMVEQIAALRAKLKPYQPTADII